MNINLVFSAGHESGHALIYYLLGHEIESISIDSYGNGFLESYTLKPTQLYYLNNNEHENYMLNWALKCLSGYASEYKFARQKFNIELLCEISKNWGGNCPSNDSEDLIEEMNIMNSTLGEEHYGFDFIKYSYQFTNDVISKPNNWLAIRALTDELLESNGFKLDGKIVHEILDSFNLEKLK